MRKNKCVHVFGITQSVMERARHKKKIPHVIESCQEKKKISVCMQIRLRCNARSDLFVSLEGIPVYILVGLRVGSGRHLISRGSSTVAINFVHQYPRFPSLHPPLNFYHAPPSFWLCILPYISRPSWVTSWLSLPMAPVHNIPYSSCFSLFCREAC
jgi:hypothetical protein